MSEEKAGQKPAEKPVAGEKKRTRYFVVNPAGAVHEVTREHAEYRLSLAGWRMATDDEIARYKQAPVQSARAPIAPADATALPDNSAETK